MEKQISQYPDIEKNGIYTAGGVSALVLAILYIVITVLYTLGGALPVGAEAWLQHLSGHTTEWWAILVLSVITDFLFLPVAWSFYIALKGIQKNVALAGACLLVLFVVLDLAITWPNYAALIGFSGEYAAAGAGQAAIVTSAAYAHEVLSSQLFGVYTILVPAIGIFALGMAMLKSVFNKVTAYLGIITGVAGVVSVFGPFLIADLGMVAVITSVLTLVWLLFAGFRLLGMGKSIQ